MALSVGSPSHGGSLLEVGQVEELEAPVALDRAVDEDHVVDCGAGPVSARLRPSPPPPRPGPALTSRDQQQDAGHEEDGARDTCRRERRAAQGLGAADCLGKPPFPLKRGPVPAGSREGLQGPLGTGGRRRFLEIGGVLTWRGSHLQSHADQDQHCTQMESRGWEREGMRAGPSIPNPQPGLGLGNEPPIPKLDAAWVGTLPKKFTKLCVFKAGHLTGPGKRL